MSDRAKLLVVRNPSRIVRNRIGAVVIGEAGLAIIPVPANDNGSLTARPQFPSRLTMACRARVALSLIIGIAFVAAWQHSLAGYGRAAAALPQDFCLCCDVLSALSGHASQVCSVASDGVF